MSRITSRIWRGGALMLALGLCWVLASQLDEPVVAPLESADVETRLPDFVGDWSGDTILFCQSEACGSAFAGEELDGVTNCPSCGGMLDPVSLGERTLLPRDTVILHRRYRNQAGLTVMVSVVISGQDQRSIHRPQQCLPAQGYAVQSSKVLRVPLDGGGSLDLAVLSANRPGSVPVVFAYWFMGQGHETASHFRRFALMGWETVRRGVRARWTYVSVQLESSAGKDHAEQAIQIFVRQLYPLIRKQR